MAAKDVKSHPKRAEKMLRGVDTLANAVKVTSAQGPAMSSSKSHSAHPGITKTA